MAGQHICTLSLNLPVANGGPSASLGGHQNARLISRKLQLPVANTIFKNGRTSTLLSQRWRAENDSRTFSLVRSAWAAQQDIDMTQLLHNQDMILHESLLSNLTAITPSHTVSAAIGNIIRRLSVDHTSSGGMPASEELERAITSGIEEKRIPAQQFGIWALIERSSQSGGTQVTDSKHDASAEHLSKRILNGCRLHRVLSGGGGWGEKQGLLALDPDSDYSAEQQYSEDCPQSDDYFRSRKGGGLEEVVRPGDKVRFYINKLDSSPRSYKHSLHEDMSVNTAHHVSMVFGSLPSTIDAMPSLLSGEDNPSCVQYADGHFGMLSESGMSLKVSTSLSELYIF